MSDPFPDDVDRFLDANIETVDQLEILRVLGEIPGKEWSAIDLMHAIQGRETEIPRHLMALHNRGLLTLERRGADIFYRYGARSKQLQELLDRLLKCYRERPVSMIKLVYARAADPLRRFSDAFRLRPEGK